MLNSPSAVQQAIIAISLSYYLLFNDDFYTKRNEITCRSDSAISI